MSSARSADFANFISTSSLYVYNQATVIGWFQIWFHLIQNLTYFIPNSTLTHCSHPNFYFIIGLDLKQNPIFNWYFH